MFLSTCTATGGTSRAVKMILQGNQCMSTGRYLVLREVSNFAKIGIVPTLAASRYFWKPSAFPITNFATLVNGRECFSSPRGRLLFVGYPYRSLDNSRYLGKAATKTLAGTEMKKNPKPGSSPSATSISGSSTDEIGSSTTSTKTETGGGSDQPLSRQAKLKQAVKDYGSTVLVFHITMSLCSLGMFYLLVSSGLDMVGLMSKIGIGEKILQSNITQGASTFVVAYAIHKVFAPVRITITLTATPLIVKKLRLMGILKKPVPK